MAEMKPGRVLQLNQAISRGNADAPTRLDDGYVSLRIPTSEYRKLVLLFPDLKDPDPVVRLAAWKNLEASELGDRYRVQKRSPRQVQRATRAGNKGIIVR